MNRKLDLFAFTWVETLTFTQGLLNLFENIVWRVESIVTRKLLQVSLCQIKSTKRLKILQKCI